MPNFNEYGLVFLPGDLALWKADEEHDGELCTVFKVIKDEDDVITAYEIIRDNNAVTVCTFEELHLPPKEIK